MNTKELAATWQTLGHKVLSSVLIDNAAVFPVLDILGRDLLWFPPKQARVWSAILQCVDSNTPPTVEAVTVRCQSGNGYVQSIANQWNDDDNRKVVYHAEELRRLGTLAELRRIGRELQAVTDPQDVTAQIEYTGNRLGGLLLVTGNRRGDAKSVSASAWDAVEMFQGRAIPTGLAWLDEITGGFWPGMNVWVAGAYKMGKSTLLRNCLLYALEQGKPADVHCAEGSRELFALDCQAMIATRLICEWGERDLDKLRLSGLFILRSWKSRDAVYTADEYNALNQAREIWESYPVRVWDTQDGIRNLATLRHRVQKSALEHGSLVHWGDYSQLFGKGKTIYERQSATALAVQEIAQEHGVVMCMLAQKNEESIKHGSNSYSAGVKGGGEAHAAADLLLIPKIEQDMKARFGVKIKYSRHTGLGNGTHVINRTSGLILDRWFKNDPPPVEFR